MMIDSSAILAIVFQEPEAHRMAVAIAGSPDRFMSTVNWLETLIVAEGRQGEASADEALLILEQLKVVLVPFDERQMYEARDAWRRYGKGRHPAALNMGDCCAYASAVVKGEPLLYKGEDFPRTNVERAAW
jgi:ribonuclease VapC